MSDQPLRKRPIGLGRGLSSLLGEVAQESPIRGGASGGGNVSLLPVGAIEPHPGQPRRYFDEAAIDELAASIAARGVIQPIVVRPSGEGYQIVAGERRWRAAQRARLHEIPAIVRELDDNTTLEIALVENIQRQDLNAIEEAQAYKRLVEEYGHSQEELGRLVHKSRSHVANLMRLLELPERIQNMIAAGELSMGHARALISAPHAEQLAEEAARKGLSVREVERLVRSGRGQTQRPRLQQPYSGADADIEALERQLGDILGLTIKITHKPTGGSVTLNYTSLDQLDLICQRLSGEPI